MMHTEDWKEKYYAHGPPFDVLVSMKSRAYAKLKKGEWILELKDGSALFQGEGLSDILELMDRLQEEMSSHGWSEVQFSEDEGDIIRLTLISEDLKLD